MTIADGADVAQGTTTDLASGSTVIGLLKNLKAALAGTLGISGAVSVSNFPASQVVSGTVGVNNFPATQAVSAVSLPLPTGAATSGNQATEITALQSIANAVVVNDSTVEPVNVMVVAGESNDAAPISGALPLGPAARSVLVEAFGALPLPTGAASETGNLAYMAQMVETQKQIIKLLSAMLVTLGNNGNGFVDPEEAAGIPTLQ